MTDTACNFCGKHGKRDPNFSGSYSRCLTTEAAAGCINYLSISERRVPKYNCKFCGNTDKTNPAECYTEEAKNSCPHFSAYIYSKVEQVNHPQHYGGDTIYETIKVLKAWLTSEQYQGFLIGNAIKYQSRYRNKGGSEDIKKALWYLNKYMEEFPK